MSVSKKNACFFLFFMILEIQQVLLFFLDGALFRVINYYDEAIAVALLLAAILYAIRGKNGKRMDAQDKMMLLFAAGYLCAGLLSNINYPLQTPFLNLAGAFICVRFVICYLAVRLIFSRKRRSENLLHMMARFSKVFTVILFLTVLLNILYPPLFKRYEFRWFMQAVAIFFTHPTYLAITAVTCAVAIMADEFLKRDKYNILFIAMDMACMMVTLRIKAIAAAVCIVFVYLYFVKFRFKTKLPAIIMCLAMALYIGWDQLGFYFGAENSDFTRFRLLRDSIKIACRFFPFGSGFSTFGSSIANIYFSPLYKMYGYSYGTRFLSDSFWPIVFAESGWIGTVFFLLLLFFMAKKILRLLKINRTLFWAASSVMIYELISSIGESAFFNPSCCSLFILLGFIMNIAEDYERYQSDRSAAEGIPEQRTKNAANLSEKSTKEQSTARFGEKT